MVKTQQQTQKRKNSALSFLKNNAGIFPKIADGYVKVFDKATNNYFKMEAQK